MREVASPADDAGFMTLPEALSPNEVHTLRDGVESAVDRVVATTPPIEATAGTIVLFTSLLVHRSDANRSERDRRALFYLYQPAGRPCLDEHQPFPAESDRRYDGCCHGDARSEVDQ